MGTKLKIAVDKINEKSLPSCPAPQTAHALAKSSKKISARQTTIWLYLKVAIPTNSFEEHEDPGLH